MYISEKRLEALKKQYPAGTKICLDHMEGERQMPPGLTGEVFHVDDAGQIHVMWQNGSTLALVPGADRFHKAKDMETGKGKRKDEPCR